jgi:acetate kinase
MSGCVAVINAGSSSVKFALHEATRDAGTLFRGQLNSIGVAPQVTVTDSKGKIVAEEKMTPANRRVTTCLHCHPHRLLKRITTSAPE